MTKFKVSQMGRAGNGYNREFTVRQYAFAECREAGVSRLTYRSDDEVRDLPGPDMKGVRKAMGNRRLVSDLYENQGVTVLPEYICAQACLGTGKFGARFVSKAAATRRMAKGRCVACQRNHFSAEKCRRVLGHTAAAARPIA